MSSDHRVFKFLDGSDSVVIDSNQICVIVYQSYARFIFQVFGRCNAHVDFHSMQCIGCTIKLRVKINYIITSAHPSNQSFPVHSTPPIPPPFHFLLSPHPHFLQAHQVSKTPPCLQMLPPHLHKELVSLSLMMQLVVWIVEVGCEGQKVGIEQEASKQTVAGLLRQGYGFVKNLQVGYFAGCFHEFLSVMEGWFLQQKSGRGLCRGFSSNSLRKYRWRREWQQTNLHDSRLLVQPPFSQNSLKGCAAYQGHSLWDLVSRYGPKNENRSIPFIKIDLSARGRHF